MLAVLSNIFKPVKDTGFRIGFVAILLVGIALIYPSFYNLGYNDPHLLHFTIMLLIGLVMSLVTGALIRDTTRTNSLRVSTGSFYKQFLVVIVGLFAGIVLVLINGGVNTGIDFITADITGNGFFLGMLAGVSEELFFRGFIQNLIRLYVQIPILAIIPSAVIFASFHFFAYGLAVDAMLVLFAMGLYLGILHEIFNDIAVPMIAHIVNNTFAMLPAVLAVVTGNVFILLLIVGFGIMAFAITAFTRRK